MSLLSPDFNPFTLEETRFLLALTRSKKRKFCELDDYLFLRATFNKLFFSRNPDNVRDTLKAAKESKLNIFATCKKRYSHVHSISMNYSLKYSPRGFALIADFGGTTELEECACGIYLSGIETIRWFSSGRDDIDLKEDFSIGRYSSVEDKFKDNLIPKLVEDQFRFNQLNFRSFQLFFLYASYIYNNKFPCSDFENALQIVWASIPDPLLTLVEFTKSFNGLDRRCMPKILNAWDWYCKLVRREEICEKFPRSLKHFSKCVIRHKLKECVQLPDGVEKLHLPKSLKDYLLLKNFNKIN